MKYNFSHHHAVAIALLSAMSLAVHPDARADEPRKTVAPFDDTALEEIIVTAGKRSESIQEVPTSITALSSDTLERLGISQFSDYMALVPGLQQNSTGVPGHGMVILRGLSTGNQQETGTVSYLIDDVPFSASGSKSQSPLLTPDPDLNDVQRIEVLKGPQGTLYGASALGGLVRIVSKEPDLITAGGSVRVDGSTVTDGGNGYALRGAFSVPLITDVAAIGGTVFHREDPGYGTNVRLGTTDLGKTDITGGRLTLRIQPTGDLEILLHGFAQDMQTYGLPGTMVSPLTLRPLYGELGSNQYIDAHFETKYRIAAAVVNWATGAGTLTNSLSYAKYTDFERFDETQGYGIVNTVLGIPLPSDAALLATVHPAMQKTTEELRFASNQWNNFEGLAGLFYTNESNEYDTLFTNVITPSLTPIPAPNGNFFTGLTGSTYTEYAGFGDLTYYLLPQFDVTAGGRFSHNKQGADTFGSGILGVLTTGSPDPVINHLHSADSSTTYLFTARYRPIATIDTYARIASGYRPGGPQAVTIPGVPLKFEPDTVKNYEVGIKGRWLDNRLLADLAIYYIDWRNIQLTQIVDGISVDGNGGHATSKGIEFDSQYRPIRGMTLGLSGAYTNARLDVADAAVGAQAGDRLPYTPEVGATATADYDFPIAQGVQGTVGGTYRYQGSKMSSFSQDTLNVDVNIPAYRAIDLRTGVEWSRYTVQLRGQNITNTRGIITASVSNVFAGQGLPAELTVIQPRTLTVSFIAKF